MKNTLLSWLHRKLKRTRASTIRHTFSFATIAALSLVAAVLLTKDASYVRLETPTRTVETGQRFAVDVYVGAHTAVNAVNISVGFPKNVVAVKGIDTGESVISIWTTEPYVSGNKVIFQGGTFRRGFLGEHLIARINFEAKTNGRAEFSVSDTKLLAGDGSGTEITKINKAPILIVAVGESGEITADVEMLFITDIDGDGDVSLSDVQTFVTAWHERQWIYDFNADRKMNFTDFAIILAHTFLR